MSGTRLKALADPSSEFECAQFEAAGRHLKKKTTTADAVFGFFKGTVDKLTEVSDEKGKFFFEVIRELKRVHENTTVKKHFFLNGKFAQKVDQGKIKQQHFLWTLIFSGVMIEALIN